MGLLPWEFLLPEPPDRLDRSRCSGARWRGRRPSRPTPASRPPTRGLREILQLLLSKEDVFLIIIIQEDSTYGHDLQSFFG